jgi:hypothetical protein
VSAEATTKAQAGIELDTQTNVSAEAAAKAGTRAEFAYARPEPAPAGATTSPEATPIGAATGSEPRPSITPPVSPTRSRSAPLAGARSKSAQAGLQAESAVPAAVQSGVDSTEQSATHIARERTAKTEDSAGTVDDRGNRVTHQGARVLGNRANQAGPVPVTLVISPVAGVVAAIALVIASITRGKAVLVGQHLLQPTDRVACTKRQPRHGVGHRGRELVRSHIDQAGIGHGLPGARDEGAGGVRVGKQVQDVLHQ